MSKNINNEQIKRIENMISTKKNLMDTALSYYRIVRNEEEENACCDKGNNQSNNGNISDGKTTNINSTFWHNLWECSS